MKLSSSWFLGMITSGATAIVALIFSKKFPLTFKRLNFGSPLMERPLMLERSLSYA